MSTPAMRSALLFLVAEQTRTWKNNSRSEDPGAAPQTAKNNIKINFGFYPTCFRWPFCLH